MARKGDKRRRAPGAQSAGVSGGSLLSGRDTGNTTSDVSGTLAGLESKRANVPTPVRHTHDDVKPKRVR